MHHRFESQQWLPYPVSTVFAFFANPDNLPRLMPAWQRARIEQASFAAPPPRPAGARPEGIAAGAGTTMTISFRPFPFAPFRMPWDATIDEFVWDDHFCDSQGRGPFAFWHHCHVVVREDRNGVTGTLLTDNLEYELPLGIFGEVARLLFVEAQIRGIFAVRRERTRELLRSGGSE